MREESFGAELRRLIDQILFAYAERLQDEWPWRSESKRLSDILDAGLELSSFLRAELERRGDRDVAWLGDVYPASELLDRLEADLREAYEARRSAFDLKNAALQLAGLAGLAGEARDRGRQVPWVSDRGRPGRRDRRGGR